MATLTDKGLIHLQHRLTVQLSRVARDDVDWLSHDDMAIKAEVLEDEAQGKRNALTTRRGQLAKAAADQSDRLAGEIEWLELGLRDLELELTATRAALAKSVTPPPG